MPKKLSILSRKALPIGIKDRQESDQMNSYPYVIMTAPSSMASFLVVYPCRLEKCGPFLRIQNFSSRFRDMNGSKEIGGRTTSDTNEFTTAVNVDAILSTCIS